MAVNSDRVAKIKQRVQDQIHSGDWWVIPVTEIEGMVFVDQLASRFYENGNSKHIQSALFREPTPDVPSLILIFAAKKCMSAAQFAELIGQDMPTQPSRNLLLPPKAPLSVMIWLHSHFPLPEAGNNQNRLESCAIP